MGMLAVWKWRRWRWLVGLGDDEQVGAVLALRVADRDVIGLVRADADGKLRIASGTSVAVLGEFFEVLAE